MQHIKVTFIANGQGMTDMLIALLSDEGYSGFEEAGNELFAYIEESLYDSENLQQIADTLQVDFSTENIAAQNWNALWESNFQPVIVDDFCTIKAHFHDIIITTPYEIQITPKMSFGTGHHATTQLMLVHMKDMVFTGKTVLDFGTGTGVLAIMAEMLGAADVMAIDNDEWSVENAQENVGRNNCNRIIVKQGSLEDVEGSGYDIILANINRHILLQYMPSLYHHTLSGGSLLMSGLLVEDEAIIKEAATAAGFNFNKIYERSNWIAMLFDKR